MLFACKQHCLQTIKYNYSRGVTEIYISTKFRYLVWFRFQDMSVESEEDDDDEQLPIVELYIYDAKDQGNPIY